MNEIEVFTKLSNEDKYKYLYSQRLSEEFVIHVVDNYDIKDYRLAIACNQLTSLKGFLYACKRTLPFDIKTKSVKDSLNSIIKLAKKDPNWLSVCSMLACKQDLNTNEDDLALIFEDLINLKSSDVDLAILQNKKAPYFALNHFYRIYPFEVEQILKVRMPQMFLQS